MHGSNNWVLKVGNRAFTFDEGSSQLIDSEGVEISLTPLPKNVLRYFLRNPLIVINKEKLIKDVWLTDFVSDNTVQQAIRSVRIALGNISGEVSIKTIRGEGYRFAATICQSPPTKEINRKNNAKFFSDIVSLFSYRSPFSEETHESCLFCDVVFSQGRLGGKSVKSPVRFRLSIAQAELHITSDLANILKIVPSSLREKFDSIDSNIIINRKRLNHTSVVFGLDAHEGDFLSGVWWEDCLVEPLLRFCDTRVRTDKEPPELGLQIICRREDLIISDIHFIDENINQEWETVSPEKRLIIELYLRDELVKEGFDVGDISDPFSVLVLADAVTYEDGK